MSVHAHIEALEVKHIALKKRVMDEMARPSPDFSRITRMKKRKLAIKEEMYQLGLGRKMAANG